MNMEETLLAFSKEIAKQYDYPEPVKIVLDGRYKYCLAYSHCDKKIIRLNKFVVEHNPIEIIKAILIHEIVHFKHCNHGPNFVREVRRMGSHERIESLFPNIKLSLKYKYQCPKCHKFGYSDKKKDFSCSYCTNDYDEEYKLELVEVNT